MEDGGGQITGKIVINGMVNNRFQDISRIVHTVADLALFKAFFSSFSVWGTILNLVFQKGGASNTVRATILF